MLFLMLINLLLVRDIDCSNKLTIEYYEKLIAQSTAEAQNFQIPARNEEFKSGSASTETTDIGSYDFIIVGAGSAGSVVATRLSEISDWRILLLEAGGEETDFSVIPAMIFYLQFSDMNWGYFSTPQKNCCLGMKDKRCMAPRGKSLGGCSAINAMMYVRGNREDFDKWVQLGNPGWSYDELLPYFNKSENAQIKGDENYHGKGGFWNVQFVFPSPGVYPNFANGHLELNMSSVDYNGKEQYGFERVHANIKHGKRQSTNTAFLDNARRRDNLKVITKALVTEIVIDEATKTAQGVIFITNNTKYKATAREEVIISAGAYNTPQLLMLSGIGPKEHLEEMDIKVIQDLPVGHNLAEHPLFTGICFNSNYTPANYYNVVNSIDQYLNGYGPLTVPVASALTFLNASRKFPLIEYMLVYPEVNLAPITDRGFNYNDELIKKYVNEINPTTITIFLVLLHPKSRGRVTLKSKDPIDFPNIDLNLFAHPEDIDSLIEGIEFVLKLADTEAFKEIDAKLLHVKICEEYERFSRDFWECSIRHMGSTIYHPHGTTAMGPNSVVDSDLKVHGVGKLRVVDAGVIPTTMSGHLSAPAVMIAEKISDVIKNDYGKL